MRASVSRSMVAPLFLFFNSPRALQNGPLPPLPGSGLAWWPPCVGDGDGGDKRDPGAGDANIGVEVRRPDVVAQVLAGWGGGGWWRTSRAVGKGLKGQVLGV
jgi:hypothetical protein